MTYKASVVLCHHTGDFVDRAVETLLQSQNVEIEIIVVTSERDREFKNTRTVYFNGGASEKRNVGFKYCSASYICFFDDDVEVDRDCVYELCRVLEREDVGMVYGKTYNMERRQNFDGAGSFLTSTGFLWAREESGIKDEGQYDIEEPVFAGKGACMAIKRKVFSWVGYFDAYYGILAEETDISWKCWLAGYKVIYVPKAILYHAFNTRFKPWNYYYTNKRVFQNGSHNYIVMLLKCLELKNLILILPIHITIWILAGIGMFFSKKPVAGFFILKGVFLIPFRWKIIMNKRRRTQNLRVKTDKELFKIIMKTPKFSFYWNRFFHYLINARHG
jgi:GT2 family glycosyltransferase